jgi:hypothetical protein
MTTLTSPDDRFLDVLAGRVAPGPVEDDAIAALLRQSLLDDDGEIEPLDDVTHKRVMNALEARGAFNPPPVATPQAADRPAARPGPRPMGPVASLLRWLPSAGLTAALMLVPAVWLLQHSSVDEPPDVQSKAIKIVMTVRVPQPEVEAGRLGALLSLQGASVSVQIDGDARVVTAQLPPDRLAQFEPLLRREGLALGVGGRLAVRFAPLEP